MSGVRDQQLRESGPWPLGVNNVADEKRLPRDQLGAKSAALREAVNVDLDVAGVPVRRKGYQPVRTGSLTHSLWTETDVPYALFVDGGQLYVLHPDEVVQPLAVTTGDQPLSYAVIAQAIYWTNAAACGLITLALNARQWAPEHPGGQPSLAAVTGFGLAAGSYQIAVTFIDDLGRESGASLAAVAQVAPDGGIQLTDIPVPNDPNTAWVAVYMTDANDTVLRLHSLQLPMVSTLLIGAPATGRALDTGLLAALPPGQLTLLFNGRQYVAKGRELLWSPVMRYGMYDPARNRMQFPAPIDVVVAIGRAGLIVAAGSRTYWLGGGDPAQFTLDTVYGAGAVPGSYSEVSGAALGLDAGDQQPVWLARDGQFVTASAGRVTALNVGTVAVDNADRAAVMFRGEEGLQQLVTTLRGPQRQGLAVTDKAVAHVIYQSV